MKTKSYEDQIAQSIKAQQLISLGLEKPKIPKELQIDKLKKRFVEMGYNPAQSEAIAMLVADPAEAGKALQNLQKLNPMPNGGMLSLLSCKIVTAFAMSDPKNPRTESEARNKHNRKAILKTDSTLKCTVDYTVPDQEFLKEAIELAGSIIDVSNNKSEQIGVGIYQPVTASLARMVYESEELGCSKDIVIPIYDDGNSRARAAQKKLAAVGMAIPVADMIAGDLKNARRVFYVSLNAAYEKAKSKGLTRQGIENALAQKLVAGLSIDQAVDEVDIHLIQPNLNLIEAFKLVTAPAQILFDYSSPTETAFSNKAFLETKSLYTTSIHGGITKWSDEAKNLHATASVFEALYNADLLGEHLYKPSIVLAGSDDFSIEMIHVLSGDREIESLQKHHQFKGRSLKEIRFILLQVLVSIYTLDSASRSRNALLLKSIIKNSSNSSSVTPQVRGELIGRSGWELVGENIKGKTYSTAKNSFKEMISTSFLPGSYSCFDSLDKLVRHMENSVKNDQEGVKWEKKQVLDDPKAKEFHLIGSFAMCCLGLLAKASGQVERRLGERPKVDEIYRRGFNKNPSVWIDIVKSAIETVISGEPFKMPNKVAKELGYLNAEDENNDYVMKSVDGQTFPWDYADIGKYALPAKTVTTAPAKVFKTLGELVGIYQAECSKLAVLVDEISDKIPKEYGADSVVDLFINASGDLSDKLVLAKHKARDQVKQYELAGFEAGSDDEEFDYVED